MANETEMLDLLQDIKAHVMRIDTRVGAIEHRLDVIEGSTTKMDNHISFVERLYDVVKWPMNKILGTPDIPMLTIDYSIDSLDRNETDV